MRRLPLLLLLILSAINIAKGFQHQLIAAVRPRQNVAISASTLPKMEFTVEDFITSPNKKPKRNDNDEDNSLAMLEQDDDETDQDLPVVEIPGEMDDTESFLQMVEATRPGRLQPTEIEIIKELLLDDSIIGNEIILERLLFRLVDEWTMVGGEDLTIMPSTEMVIRVMRAWQNRIGTDRSQRNTEILPEATNHIMDIYYRVYDTCFANDDQKNMAIAEIALETLCYRRGVSRQVQSIVKSYQYPSPKMMEYWIVALARDGKPKVAERILRKERNLVISVETLNSIITGYAKTSNHHDQTKKEHSTSDVAEQLVVYMTDERELQPNASTFTCLMDCYAQQRTWWAAEKCQGILDKMIALDDPNISPNIVAWTSVMSTWGKLTNTKPDAVHKVNDLMERLQASFAPGNIDSRVYKTWMRANAASRTREGLVKAESILNEMLELYLDGSDESFQPDAQLVQRIIDAWLQSDLPRKVVEASRIAEEYESVLETSNEMYSSVWRALILAWTQAGNPVHAESYLEQLIERVTVGNGDVADAADDDGSMMLDSFCFDVIIESNTAIHDANAMQRSVRIFERLEQCRLAARVQPTERVYTSFIKAMIKAKVPQLLRKTQAIINRMQELSTDNDDTDGQNRSIQPTIFTYNAVLSACAEVNGDNGEQESCDDALAMAIRTFYTIRTNHLDTIDPVSIGAMLRCANLIRNDDVKRSKWIESTFRLACNEGVVNTNVLNEFKRLAPAELWRKTLGDFIINMDNDNNDQVVAVVVDESSIPEHWKQNARRHYTYTTRTTTTDAPRQGGSPRRNDRNEDRRRR